MCPLKRGFFYCVLYRRFHCIFALYLKGLDQDSLGDVGEEGGGEFYVLIVSHDLLEPSQVVCLQLHVQLETHKYMDTLCAPCVCHMWDTHTFQ